MTLPPHIVESGNGFYKDTKTGKFYHESFIKDVVDRWYRKQEFAEAAKREAMSKKTSPAYIERRMFMQNIQAARRWGVGIFETMG